MSRIILLALIISLFGCGVSISPVPGVSIYIPFPTEILDDAQNRDKDKDDKHRN